MKVIISHYLVSVWPLIVRERLALSNDFCMNLWLWNECMSLKMMKAMIDWNNHLAKKHTLWMNDISLAPMLSWKFNCLTWTLSLWNYISIYRVLGCRRALWFKENLSQIWGSMLGDSNCGKTNNSHTKISKSSK